MKLKYKSIRINVIDFEYIPGKLLCKGDIALQNEFAEYVSELIRKDLVNTIESQSRSSKWAPLSTRYLDHKKSSGLSTKTWKATGNMVESIYLINKKDKILIGVTSSRKYPNSNQTLLEVARYLEYGTSRIPARPLFRPIVSNYYRNTSKHWSNFMKNK